MGCSLPENMRRKLIPQGRGGSLTIYLPKKWATEQALNPSDEVELEEEGQKLIITPVGGLLRREKSLSVTPAVKERLRTLLSTAYRCGYERLVMEGEGLSVATTQEIVESLPGFMIIEESKKQIIIENFVDERLEPPERILRRLFHRVGYFLQAVINASPDVETLRRSIFQLRDYAQRTIFVTNYGGERRYEWYVLVFLVEKVAGNYYDAFVAKNLPQDVLEEHAETYQQLIEALYKKDIGTATAFANKLSRERKALYRESKERRGKGGGRKEGRGTVHPLRGVLNENLFSMASRIAGLIL